MADDFKELPKPNYEYDIQRLVSYYKKAMLDIQRELERMDLTNYQRANATALLKQIADILRELDEQAAAWVEEQLPQAVEDGIIRAIIALGVAETVEQAATLVKFNRMNIELIKAVVADTQSDLLQITQNVDRKVRTTIRQVTGEVLRANVTKGINGTSALTSDLVRKLRQDLGNAVDTGIIDASNRRWKPEVYAEMVVRTKMLEAHKESTMNEAVQRGAMYAVISSHGAKDACSKWENRVIRLSYDAPGDFPHYNDLPRREIFHPNCKHVLSVFKRPDRLPDNIKEINGI